MKKGTLKHITILASIALAAILSFILSFSFFLAETKLKWNEILDVKGLGIVIILLQILAAVLLVVFLLYLIILSARSKSKKDLSEELEKKEEEPDYSYIQYVYDEQEDLGGEQLEIMEEVEEVQPYTLIEEEPEIIEEPKEVEEKEEIQEEIISEVEETKEEEPVLEDSKEDKIDESELNTEPEIEESKEDDEEEIDEALFEEFDEDNIDESEFEDDEEDEDEPASKTKTQDGIIVFEEGSQAIKNETVIRTFLNKMSTQPDDIKEFYSELRNEFLSYKGVSSRTNYGSVVFKYEDQVIAKFTALSKMIRLHLAKLKIDNYNYNKFFQFSLAERKIFEEVPFTTRVKSKRGTNNAKLLIADLMKKLGTTKKEKTPSVDYYSNFGQQDFSLLKRLGMQEYILDSASKTQTDKFISTEKAEAIFNRTEKVKDINISQYDYKLAEITTQLLEDKYRDNQAVTLTSLKRRGLIDRDVTSVKLSAEGTLTKQLDVRLQEMTPTAIKMILAVGGNVVKQTLK